MSRDIGRMECTPPKQLKLAAWILIPMGAVYAIGSVLFFRAPDYGGSADISMRAGGVAFLVCGVALLAIGACLFLAARNRMVSIDDEGAELTGLLGGADSYPWDELRVVDENAGRGRMSFVAPGRTMRVRRAWEGYTDMRSHLKAKGLLVRPDGRKVPRPPSGDQMMEVERLF